MENGKFDRLLDTTEALLAACKERGIYAATPRKLFIPVFGHVHVRRITIGEIDDQMDDPPNADKKWRAARNATRLLCNEQGKRLFDPNNAEHVQAMAEMDLDVLTAISETTRKEDTAEGN